MENKTLYSRDSNGRVRVWSMTQDGDSFVIHSGLQDGQIVTSEPTKCLPKNIGKKNETTGEQQCALEIEARYKKQLKTGYHEDINNIDNKSYIEPMLAKKYQDYENKIDFSKKEYFVQCKFNGIRCTITNDSMKTREGEDILSAPHIFESLKPFFELNPDAVLDGELFNNDLREQLNEINKLVRRTVHITDEDLIRSKKMVKYYIYDGFGFGNLDQNKPYYLRKQFIDENLLKYKYIEFVETFEVESFEQFMEIYDRYVSDKQEGCMLRLKDGGYENKRSKNLLKFKPTDDAEFEFLGVEEGKGNWGGLAKIVNLKMDNGKIFNATFKGTQKEALVFLGNHKHLIGKQVTVTFNGFTGLGTPNFAQFDYNNHLK